MAVKKRKAPAARYRRRKNPIFFDIWEVMSYELVGHEIGRRAKALERDLTKLTSSGGAIRQANLISLAFMQKEAVKNLNNSIKSNRTQRDRSGRLEATILNPRSHSNTKTGFKFMVVSKVDTIMGKNHHYAFSLEFGSSYWVGKKLPFAFLGRANPVGAGKGRRAAETSDKRTYNRNAPLDNRGFYRANQARSTRSDVGVGRFNTGRDKRIVADRVIGPREWKRQGKPKMPRFLVTIRRPVPEYAYGRKAAQAFEDSNLYGREILRLTKQFQKEHKIKVKVRGLPSI